MFGVEAHRSQALQNARTKRERDDQAAPVGQRHERLESVHKGALRMDAVCVLRHPITDKTDISE